MDNHETENEGLSVTVDGIDNTLELSSNLKTSKSSPAPTDWDKLQWISQFYKFYLCELHAVLIWIAINEYPTWQKSHQSHCFETIKISSGYAKMKL